MTEPTWLASGLAGAVSAGLAPEEAAAWRVVDALGLLLAEDGQRGDRAIAPLHVWQAPDLVGLDFAFDPADPSIGLRILVSPEAVELRLPVVAWRGDEPVVRSFLWQRLAWRSLDRGAIADLVRQALAVGRSIRRTCTGCGAKVALGRYVLHGARVVCFTCGLHRGPTG